MKCSSKLRLLITPICNRNCEGCCNKEWDLAKIPKCESFEGYDEIILTGGEPMLLDYCVLRDIVIKIRKVSDCKIYLYTAECNDIMKFSDVLLLIDGITLTLHEQDDVRSFIELNEAVKYFECVSMRLHVFEGIDLTGIDTSRWIVKDNIKWIENCPLPENEVFMRL